jgi:hypothetical protein
MRIILNLEEDIIEGLNGYASHTNQSVDDVVSGLFKKYLLDPNATLQRTNPKLVDYFSQTLTEYLNEAILDIDALSKSNEKSLDDKPMMNVFQTLNRDVVTNPYVFSKLLHTYLQSTDAKGDDYS